jgi:sortase (surface protein transpeptidase)
MGLRHITDKKRLAAGWLLVLAGVAVLGFLFFRTHDTGRVLPGAPRPAARADAPSSVKPSAAAVASYQVAPELPKYLAIPAIGVTQTRIIGLGTKGNQIANPDNLHDAGWYKASAKPGQAGAMFIFGHLSDWTAKGVFYDLKKLKPGDNITVERGDGKAYTYKVKKTQTYLKDAVDMQAVLAPIEPNVPGLNVMTCAGKVIAGTDDFNERLVVFTSLAK